MLNNICIQGRIVRNPEVKTTTSGVTVCTFSVAVERSRASQDGTRETDFFSVTSWRGTAEFVGKYFPKGSWIVVNGRMESRKFDNKHGEKQTAWELQADNVHFCGNRSDSTGAQDATAEATRGDAYDSDLGSKDAQTGFTAVDDDDLPF